MSERAPGWISHASALDDADRYARMTPDERLSIFVDICELAESILDGRPDRERILAENEPMPPAAEAAWRRLIARSRDERTTR